MSAEPTPAPTDTPAEDAQFYRRALHRMIDITLDLADMIHAEAKAQSQSPEPNSDLLPALTSAAAAIDDLSRTVRRTVMLAQRVADPAPTAAQRRAADRRRILRDVEDAIHRSERKGADKEFLTAELHERLDAPDLLEDVGNRPMGEIIADICRDLGVAGPSFGPHPWKRRTPEDVAALCARAAQPGPAGSPEPDPASLPAVDPERLFRLIATPNGR